MSVAVGKQLADADGSPVARSMSLAPVRARGQTFRSKSEVMTLPATKEARARKL